MATGLVKMLVDKRKGSSALLSGTDGWEFDGVETLRPLSMPVLQSVSAARSSSACTRCCMRVDFPAVCWRRPCGHRHREYYYMCPGGSLAEIEALVCDCLALIGEANTPR
jgi:hypothetical protein